MLQKREKVIYGVKYSTNKKSQNFGIHVPCPVEESYDLYKVNNNMLWRDVITKYVNNGKVAFDFQYDDQKFEPGREHME